MAAKTPKDSMTAKKRKQRKPTPQKRTRISRQLTSKVDRLFAEWDKPDSPGAALAVIQNGSVIYQRGYGSANLEYSVPIAPASIFHIASVSKQFTTMAITMLAHQGKLSLDDDIRQHLSEVPNLGKTITIRHLIYHTSGLRDQWELLAMAGWRLDDVITREHILKMVKRQKALNFDPGEEHLYCNTGYTLMAEIVERVTGQSFREFTEKEIFKPLNMIHTHFHDNHEMIVKNRTYSYEPKDGGGFKHCVLSYANVGATSLFTTVEDLAKWILNFGEGKVGGKAVIAQMHEQGVLNNGKKIDYAFGLSIGKYRGLRTVGHGGADAGYRSFLLRFPERRFAVVILSNLGSFDPYRLATRVADVFLEDQFESLAEFAGDYFSEELDTTYTIVMQENKLMAKHSRHDDISLTYQNTDQFEGDKWWFREVQFVRNQRKRVTGFQLTGGRVRNLQFDKR